MVDRFNSERLRGFCDRQTDICNSRVAFATENWANFDIILSKSVKIITKNLEF